jgi:hypothetical protein
MTVIKDVARYAMIMNPEPGRERILEPMMSGFRMSLSKMLNMLQHKNALSKKNYCEMCQMKSGKGTKEM